MTKIELRNRHLTLKAQIELALLDSSHPDEIAKRKMERIIEEWGLDDSAESHNFLVKMMG